jgi:hypothetical protein
VKKRSRFVSDKEKVKIIKKIKKMKKVEKIMSLSSRKRISNKSRIIDIWKNEMNEKKFLIKLKSAQIIFSLIEIIVFVSLVQKIFSKILFEDDVIKFHVNSIRSRLITQKERNSDMFMNFLKQRLSLKTSSESLNWWIQKRKLMWWSKDWWTKRR